ncbi:hypothetical protein HY504_00870 [Candidatus Wolfebacteria bacterium]|nr:hypothetical protein [Candidatus Wolfebacteria bacterium]
MRFSIFALSVIFLSIAYGAYLFIPKTPAPTVLDALRLENLILRADVRRLVQGFADSSCNGSEFVSANVFGTYPLNVKNEITLNKGTLHGVRERASVLLGCSIFVGFVSQTFSSESIARTLYDASFEAPVQIGEGKVNGLLRGGTKPKVTLIEKPVKRGESVFIVARGYPYGLVAGEVDEVRSGAGDLLEEADLRPAFSASELRTVTIVR